MNKENRWSLEKFRDLLESNDKDNHKLALVMIEKSFNIKSFNLHELMMFREEFTKYTNNYSTNKFTGESNRIKMKIFKAMSKFSKANIKNYQNKIIKDE